MPVRFEPDGGVVIVTIDRPEALNAIDPETSDALVAAWERFRDDDALRAAVLTGAGDKAFSAGIDLKRIAEWYARVPKDAPHEHWASVPGLGGITRNLDPGKPVIAAVNGHCLGGGLELALACDIRVAGTNATFALPETRWGIIPGQGGTQRLPRAIAPNVALEMVLAGETLDAHRAYEVGLVNRVHEPAELMSEATALAHRIAERPPNATRVAREAIRRGLQLPLEDALLLEQELAHPLRGSDENRSAVEAFGKK